MAARLPCESECEWAARASGQAIDTHAYTSSPLLAIAREDLAISPGNDDLILRIAAIAPKLIVFAFDCSPRPWLIPPHAQTMALKVDAMNVLILGGLTRAYFAQSRWARLPVTCESLKRSQLRYTDLARPLARFLLEDSELTTGAADDGGSRALVKHLRIVDRHFVSETGSTT